VVIANALHTYRIPLNRITAITYEFRVSRHECG